MLVNIWRGEGLGVVVASFSSCSRVAPVPGAIAKEVQALRLSHVWVALPGALGFPAPTFSPLLERLAQGVQRPSSAACLCLEREMLPSSFLAKGGGREGVEKYGWTFFSGSV